MSEHSSLVGGSSAGRYIGCIGSNDLISRAPPQQVGPAAWTGTALHHVAEMCLNADPDHEDADPLTYIGDALTLDNDIDPETNLPVTIEITEELILGKVVPAIKWFEEVLNPEQAWFEQKVEFLDAELKGAFGTADVLFIDGDRAGIADWKFGRGVVTAEDNDQLKFYLAAALHLQWFYDMTKHINMFDGYIVQPTDDPEGEIASFAQFSRDELLDFTTSLIEAKKAKDAGDTTLTTGDHCKFCPAETICPAWRDRGKDAIAPLVNADVPRGTFKSGAKKGQPKPVTPPAAAKHVLDDATHTALREMYLEVKEIMRWGKAVSDYVKKEFDAGRPIEGLKKVVYQNERHFVDEKKAANWVRRQGFKAADYNEPTRLKSVAQIEKLVGAGKIPDDHIRIAPKGFSYVSMDDPKPAYDDGNDPQSTSQLLAKSIAGKQESET